MSEKPQPDWKLVFENFAFCFTNFFTLEETTAYIREKHGDDLKTGKIKAIFENIKSRHSDYQENSEARSIERKMRTQAYEWSTNQKMAVLNDRLKILPQARHLVKNLSQLEKDTLCFFITKEWFLEDGTQLYIRSGIHRTCFHCHCFICYTKFCHILGYLRKGKLIKRIIDEFDEVATRTNATLQKAITDATQEKATTKAPQEKAGEKKAGKKKAGKKKAGK